MEKEVKWHDNIAGEGLKFHCPECGGSAFGTTVPDHPDWSTAIGRCHGNDARDNDGRAHCSFQWNRNDDKLYFF